MNSANCNKRVLELDICRSAKYASVFKEKAFLRLPARTLLYHEALKR